MTIDHAKHSFLLFKQEMQEAGPMFWNLSNSFGRPHDEMCHVIKTDLDGQRFTSKMEKFIYSG